MYRATFTCHDRNGDDGIYSTHDGSIGETWHHTIADAICAIMADAEAHRDMYTNTAEKHWHDAFATAADAFATMLHDGTTRRPIESITYLISGDHDPADDAPWTLGTYTITTGHPTCAECRTTLTGYTIPNGINGDSITCHACGLDADLARHYAAKRARAERAVADTTCPECDGQGIAPSRSGGTVCPDCDGQGTIQTGTD